MEGRISCPQARLAYLHVFREAVWTITYMELMKKKDLTEIGS